MTPEARTQVVHYQFDPAASTFTVQAFSEGLLSVFGHDPVIAIKDFSGEAELVPGTFADASFKLTIQAKSLAVTDHVKGKDRLDIERTMHVEVLESGKYPEISYRSNNISLSSLSDGHYSARVIGDLTLHGVTRNNLRLNGEVTVTPDGLRAKGQCSIKQTDYKIKLVSVAGGTLKIKDEVKCSFDILVRAAR